MLLVKTRVGLSEFNGLGLFSDQEIKANITYWIRNDLFDKIFPIEVFNNLPELTTHFIKRYGFLQANGIWYLCNDNARFSNHSDNPNTSNHFDENGLLQFCTTKIDISYNEEIFIDYKEICQTCKDGVLFDQANLTQIK